MVARSSGTSAKVRASELVRCRGSGLMFSQTWGSMNRPSGLIVTVSTTTRTSFAPPATTSGIVAVVPFPMSS